MPIEPNDGCGHIRGGLVNEYGKAQNDAELGNGLNANANRNRADGGLLVEIEIGYCILVCHANFGLCLYDAAECSYWNCCIKIMTQFRCITSASTTPLITARFATKPL
jgi:hypothetical protein